LLIQVVPLFAEHSKAKAKLAHDRLGRGEVGRTEASHVGHQVPSLLGKKLLLAGAGVMMTTSSLSKRGPEHLRTLLEGIHAWLGEK
jgi:hypothetical protein